MARKTHLKLRFAQEFDMSKNGLMAWSRRARPKVHKKVYKWVYNDYVDVEQIKNKELLGYYAYNHLWQGIFLMFGYSHGKTKTHVKLVLLAKLNLRINNDKYNCDITRNWRLSRYWFFKK